MFHLSQNLGASSNRIFGDFGIAAVPARTRYNRTVADELDNPMLAGILRDSRAVFALRLDPDLNVLWVSNGYRRLVSDLTHIPEGSGLFEIAVKTASAEAAIAASRQPGGAPVRISLLLNPPFRAPRNVSGYAIAASDGNIALVLECDFDRMRAAVEGVKPEKPTIESISHSMLLDAYEEMSNLRQSLSSAEDRIKAYEVEMRFRDMYVKLLTQIADRARELASLALIICAKMDERHADFELLTKLENEGNEISVSAMRLARALK